MAYERNTTEGIRTWLTTELSSPGWNSSSIAKGLTEDLMIIIADDFNLFETKIRQAIILSTMYMRKGDLLSLSDGLNKVLQLAVNDKDDFVRTTANVLKDYPDTQLFNLNIDTWSEDFRSLLNNIGSSIKKNGFNFHPLEDMILQPCARTTPPFVSSNYTTCKSTHAKHFSLTTNPDDIISSESRHLRFKELVESEERLEQAEAQAAQAVAQKRAGAELQNKSKRIASPTNNLQNPFPFPPANAPPRSYSLGSVPSAASSSLYTKRPARPAPSGGGGLFIKQQKPSQRPIQRQTPGIQKPVHASSVPRGLQRVQKTQMLDFSAATEFEQNTANAVKRAQDEIKAKAEAKKAEALEKKQRIANEKREREEARRAQKEHQAALAAERVAERAAADAERAAADDERSLPRSPTSAPNSPRTPKSPPKSPRVKSEHVFAIPALPGHFQQGQQPKEKTPPTEKLTTF